MTKKTKEKIKINKISITIYHYNDIDKKKQFDRFKQIYNDFDSFEINFFKWDN